MFSSTRDAAVGLSATVEPIVVPSTVPFADDWVVVGVVARSVVAFEAPGGVGTLAFDDASLPAVLGPALGAAAVPSFVATVVVGASDV